MAAFAFHRQAGRRKGRADPRRDQRRHGQGRAGGLPRRRARAHPRVLPDRRRQPHPAEADGHAGGRQRRRRRHPRQLRRRADRRQARVRLGRNGARGRRARLFLLLRQFDQLGPSRAADCVLCIGLLRPAPRGQGARRRADQRLRADGQLRQHPRRLHRQADGTADRQAYLRLEPQPHPDRLL